MATDQSSSESTPQKRQRRLKQDPQFIFEHSTTNETEPEKIPQSNKQKSKSIQPVEENTIGADLYEPGDIVWSKLGSFPWWPALIYRCDAEGGIHTRTLNSYNKSKRQFFVYFYGKYLEYSWLSTRSLLKYAGLTNFIQHAEAAVQQASTKSEQSELANRYQLKVSMKKRVQWDEAIELADHALTITRDERIQEFRDLLNGAQHNKKQSRNDARRRKASLDKKQDEAVSTKHHAGISLSSSFSSEIPDEIKTVEKSVSLQTDNDKKEDDQQPIKKKRGRKSKAELQGNKTLNTNKNHLSRTQINRLISSPLTHTNLRKRKITNDSEFEYEYPPSSNGSQISSPLIHLIQANIPPLSNYEQKQIVQDLLHHPQEKTLTFDEAQAFATKKATDIVYENHHHRMGHISSEWFYDSILLKYPSIVFKYRSWFEHVRSDVIPNETDPIILKQWQIALMIEVQIKAEQRLSNT